MIYGFRVICSAEIILSQHERLCFLSKTMPDIFGNISSTHLFCPSLNKSHSLHCEQNTAFSKTYHNTFVHFRMICMSRSWSANIEYKSFSPECFSKKIPGPECSRTEVKILVLWIWFRNGLQVLVACF